MKKNMIFYNLLDFFQRKETIKEEYDLLTIDEREIYKMFVYSLPFMEEDIKDEIWEYLNDWLEDYEKLCYKHDRAKRRYEKRKKEEQIWDM